MARILIIKTAALGDVLRTTSILPGLAARHPGAAITWVTAADAVPLVAHHPLVERSVPVDPGDAETLAEASEQPQAEADSVEPGRRVPTYRANGLRAHSGSG